VRLLSAAAPIARLLDVGCGEGAFLAAARSCGLHVTGTEMNPVAAREAGLSRHAPPAPVPTVLPGLAVRHRKYLEKTLGSLDHYGRKLLFTSPPMRKKWPL
jgi:SAM-dependent methyltransferase